MSAPKGARPDHPIHELLSKRWSPYAFADRDVSDDDLRSLFEAARWAASSYNEQPWSYIVATRSERAEFERLLSCLMEGNQAWACHVPVLALGITREAFTRNGKPNAAAQHDLGLASENLVSEATTRGLCVHQMIGIVPDRARELYGIPEDSRALTAIGGTRTIKIDVRLVAATNRDLVQMVEEHRFRDDLYYRLNVFPIYAPPLRERPEDIEPLVRHFAQHFAARMQRRIEVIPTETLDALRRYAWPGNVRELENLIERAVILSAGSRSLSNTSPAGLPRWRGTRARRRSSWSSGPTSSVSSRRRTGSSAARGALPRASG